MPIYHKHHIVPKHAGGTDDPSNIAILTIEEHAEAHRILYEKYGRWQDKLAYEGLLKLNGNEHLKKVLSEAGKRGAQKTNSKKNFSSRNPHLKPPSKRHKQYSKEVDGRKIRENRYWYTNGLEEMQTSHKNVPLGWYRGRLKRL